LDKLISSAKARHERLKEVMSGHTKPAEDKPEEKKEEKKDEPVEKKSNDKKKGKDTSEKKEEPKPTEPTKEQIEEGLKSFNDLKDKIADMDFKKFSFVTYPDCIIYEDHAKPQKYRCLNSIFKSIYNQSKKDEEKNGDLVYLDIYTLEGKVLYVTCSEKGFFVNNSTATSFDALPSSYPCYSFTLTGLLSQASPLFKENFTKLISQVLSVEQTLFEPSPNDRHDWLASHENPFYYNYRFKAFQTEMENMMFMRLNKEWNEEFQTILDINFQNDPLQNLTKEKLLVDFYKLFKETAVEVSYHSNK
jgi:hypothetical protein